MAIKPYTLIGECSLPIPLDNSRYIKAFEEWAHISGEGYLRNKGIQVFFRTKEDREKSEAFLKSNKTGWIINKNKHSHYMPNYVLVEFSIKQVLFI